MPPPSPAALSVRLAARSAAPQFEEATKEMETVEDVADAVGGKRAAAALEEEEGEQGGEQAVAASRRRRAIVSDSDDEDA